MNKQNQAVYQINYDLELLKHERLFTKECEEGAEHYEFDIDDYPLKAPEITPENYALPPDDLKEMGQLVNRLRAGVVNRAAQMLNIDLNDDDLDIEIIK